MEFEDFAEVNAAMQRAKQLQLQRQLLEKIDNLDNRNRERVKIPPKYSDSLTEKELRYYEELSERQFEREQEIREHKCREISSAMKPAIITTLVILLTLCFFVFLGFLNR